MACVLIYSAQQTLGTIYPGSHRTKYTYHKGICYGVAQSQEEKLSFKPLLRHSGAMLALVLLPDTAEDSSTEHCEGLRDTAELGYSEAGLLKNCLLPGCFTQLPNHLVCRRHHQKLHYSDVLAQKHLKRTCLNIQEGLNLICQSIFTFAFLGNNLLYEQEIKSLFIRLNEILKHHIHSLS